MKVLAVLATLLALSGCNHNPSHEQPTATSSDSGERTDYSNPVHPPVIQVDNAIEYSLFGWSCLQGNIESKVDITVEGCEDKHAWFIGSINDDPMTEEEQSQSVSDQLYNSDFGLRCLDSDGVLAAGDNLCVEQFKTLMMGL